MRLTTASCIIVAICFITFLMIGSQSDIETKQPSDSRELLPDYSSNSTEENTEYLFGFFSKWLNSPSTKHPCEEEKLDYEVNLKAFYSPLTDIVSLYDLNEVRREYRKCLREEDIPDEIIVDMFERDKEKHIR